MPQSTIDVDFDALLKADLHTNYNLEFESPYEIDAKKDADFGELYRIWEGRNLCGTFYETLDGKWIAQPVKASINGRFNTSTQAILVIVAINENPQLQQVV